MEEKSIQDYLAAFKRCRSAFVWIFSGILTLSLLVALLIPPTYRSSATILIEEQEIPTELVRSTITTYAAQRLQMINQRVMTRANLEKIIHKFDLYPKERQKLTSEEVIEKMRKDLDFAPISAEVIDPRTGQPSKATIAFSLTYDGRNPELVQRVASEVTSLYLEENLKQRTQKTAETSSFLQEEAKHMAEYVSQVESRLADFKQQHIHSLPEQKELNFQFRDRTENEISQIDNQLRSLEERRFYLDAQMAQVEPLSPVMTATGERSYSPNARLKALKAEYTHLVAMYADKHPDVVKLRQEIDALTKEIGGGDDSTEQARELQERQRELAKLSERYSSGHPDVVKLKRHVDSLEQSVRQARALGAVREAAEAKPDNPAYITLQTQRDTTIQEMAALSKRQQELRAKLNQYERRLSETPDVERQYLELLRDYENASAKYRELKAKELEANIAEQLEKKSKGERFSIIEPPMLPEKPVKPNRTAIGFLGFVLAVAGGLAYVLLNESMDKSVRGMKAVIALTGQAPLAVVPFLESDDVVSAKKRRWLVAASAFVAIILIALLLIHWLWTPLDVLWFRGLRKMDQVIG